MAQAVQVAKEQTPISTQKPVSVVDPFQDLSKIDLKTVSSNLNGLVSREQIQKENVKSATSRSYSFDISSELGTLPSTTYANGNKAEGIGNQNIEPEQLMSMQSSPSSSPLQQVHKTPLGNLIVERGETKSNAKGQKYNDYTIRVPDGYDLQADETIEQLSTGRKKTLDNPPTIYGTDDPNVFKVRVHQGNKYGLHLVGNGRGLAERGVFVRDRNGKKSTLPVCNYPELEETSRNLSQTISPMTVPPISTCVSKGSASKSRAAVINGKNCNLYSIRILPGMVIEPELRIQRLSDREVLERDKNDPVIYSDLKDPNIIQIAIPQGFRYQFHIRNGYSGQVLRNRNEDISTFSITNLPRMPEGK